MPKELVREPLTGVPLLCCWDDCGQWGDNRIRESEKEGKYKEVFYIFCSEGHRDFWRNSVRSYGNHSSGNRNDSIVFIPGAKK